MSIPKLLSVLAAAQNLSGSVYLGQEQFITLAAVIGVLGAVLVFLLKHQFSEMVGAIHNSGQELQNVKEELCERILSSHAELETQVKESSRKIDQVLLLMNEKKG